MTHQPYSLKKLLIDLEAHIRIMGLAQSETSFNRALHMLELLKKIKRTALPDYEDRNVSVVTAAGAQIHGLAYISRSNVLEENLPAELERLVSFATERNKQLGITGYLLYRSGYFIQLLEGPKENLELVYGRIALDKRHGRLRLLFDGELKQRQFPDWGMDFSISTADEDQKFKKEFAMGLEEGSQVLSANEITTLLNYLKNFSLKRSRI